MNMDPLRIAILTQATSAVISFILFILICLAMDSWGEVLIPVLGTAVTIMILSGITIIAIVIFQLFFTG